MPLWVFCYCQCFVWWPFCRYVHLLDASSLAFEPWEVSHRDCCCRGRARFGCCLNGAKRFKRFKWIWLKSLSLFCFFFLWLIWMKISHTIILPMKYYSNRYFIAILKWYFYFIFLWFIYTYYSHMLHLNFHVNFFWAYKTLRSAKSRCSLSLEK